MTSAPEKIGWMISLGLEVVCVTTATSGDRLVVEVIDVDPATATAVFTAYGAPVERNASWKLGSVDLSAFAGKTIRIRISATDAGTNGIVEAAVDDVRVTQPQ